MRLSVAAVILGGVILALFLLAIIVFPKWIVPNPRGLGALTGSGLVAAENALVQSRNSVRGTLIQAIGGALVLLTFAVGFGQLMTTRRGQVIDRFTKTIEQLGSDKVDVRLGGIYGLRQVAANQVYARPIAEIYAAYLKTHSATEFDRSGTGSQETEGPVYRPFRAVARELLAGRSRVLVEPAREIHHRSEQHPDLQAVLRILVLEGLWKDATSARLDLSDINVERAELPWAPLSNSILLRASLTEANLEHADLSGSDLQEIDLSRARLQHADLRADLSRSILAWANLDNAKLDRGLLVKADLRHATLTTPHLVRTDATGADFRDADLNGARLTGTIMTDALLGGASFVGATLVGTRLGRANLTEADFTDAKLTDVVLTDAILRGAKGLDTAIMDETTRQQVNELLHRSHES